MAGGERIKWALFEKMIEKHGGPESLVEETNWEWTGSLKKGESKSFEIWVKVYIKGYGGYPYLRVRSYIADPTSKFYGMQVATTEGKRRIYPMNVTDRPIIAGISSSIGLRVGLYDKWIPMNPEDLPDEIKDKITPLNNGWKIIAWNSIPHNDWFYNPIYNYKDPSTGTIINPVK